MEISGRIYVCFRMLSYQPAEFMIRIESLRSRIWYWGKLQMQCFFYAYGGKQSPCSYLTRYFEVTSRLGLYFL